MRIYAQTDIGNRRSSNQDTFRIKKISENFGWMLVCDGMGGVNGGDIASQTAADIIEEILNADLNPNLTDIEIRELIFDSINEANSDVFSKSVTNPELKGMGTTVVLAIIFEDRLYISHVGDSRGYMSRLNLVKQITEDHSYVQDLVNRGEISKEEAKVHPHKNIITRSLGVHSIVEIDTQVFHLLDGDVIVMCTDGLSDYLEDDMLLKFIKNINEDNITKELVGYALECGGHDNITVTVAYC